LSMVVQSSMRNPPRPVALIPVYISYDKVIEVTSYVRELAGGIKRKESASQLFKARKFLNNSYGKAYVGFGEPVLIGEELTASGHTTAEAEDGRPPWFHSFLHGLSFKIASRINEAAIVNGHAITALALLATPQRALPESDLIFVVEKMLKLNAQTSAPTTSLAIQHYGSDTIQELEKLESFKRFQHGGGDVIHLSEFDSVPMSYYKNNILHLFALPALLARFFQHRDEIRREELLEGAVELYPFLQDEFFLVAPAKEAEGTLVKVLDAMIDLKILRSLSGGDRVGRPEVSSPEALCLTLLGNTLGLVFERYTIMAAMLANHLDKGSINIEEFEHDCQKLVHRLMILSGVHTPESTDRSLFASHIKFLRRIGVLEAGDEGRLRITPRIRELSHRSTMMLSSDMRASIERMTSLGG